MTVMSIYKKDRTQQVNVLVTVDMSSGGTRFESRSVYIVRRDLFSDYPLFPVYDILRLIKHNSIKMYGVRVYRRAEINTLK
jgi:hypothetical protein